MSPFIIHIKEDETERGQTVMTRKNRIESSDGLYHIIIQGNGSIRILRYQGCPPPPFLALTCPSTTLQMFVDIAHTEWLTGVMEPPACLFHLWRDDIGLVTHTNYIGDYGPVRVIHDGKGWLPPANNQK